MAVVQLTKGFVSPASAERFLENIELDQDPIVSRFAHPMGYLFAASMNKELRDTTASLIRTPVFSAAQVAAKAAAQVAGNAAGRAAVQAAANAVAQVATSAGGGAGGGGTGDVTDAASLDTAINIRNQVKQNFVVGNGVISFNDGVTSDRKRAAVTSTLLAQLLADKLYPDKAAKDYAKNWYSSYFNTLINIGWIIQGDNSIHHTTGGTDVDVDKEIISLVSSLVGSGGASAVAAIFNSLKNLSTNDPVITLFKQTSQTESVAQFTVSLASQDAPAGFLLKAMEFDLTATGVNTQILFFNWTKTQAVFNWRNLEMSVDDDVFSEISDKIIEKIKSHVTSFVKEIPDI